MKVLVMGGTRFNGLTLVHELVRHGHDVTIFNRGQTEAAIPSGVRRLLGDRHDHAAMREVFGDEEFDAIYDISAYTTDDVASMVDIFRGRTGHYIFASTTVIYAPSRMLPMTEDSPVAVEEPQSEYGRNKVLCERLLLRAHREHGFPATIVPFSMVFGPNNIIAEREQRMFARLLAGRPVLIPGDGTTLGQIGHVEDEARGLRMVMGHQQTIAKRYNLTGRDYWSDEAYVDTFAEVVGVTPRKVFVPNETMGEIEAGKLNFGFDPVEAPGSRGMDEARLAQLHGRARITQMIQRLGSPLHPWNWSTVFSSDRLRRDTGWEPDYTFSAAVAHTYEWFRREGLDETRQFDFAWEDALLEHLGEA